MALHIGLFFGFVALLWLVVALASKGGNKAAQVEALKQEIKKRAEEQAHAQKILNDVSNMSADDVRKRLQDISGK